MFFSSEAFDTYGPEKKYKDHLGVWSDDLYWDVIENLEEPSFLIEEIGFEKYKEIEGKIVFTEIDADALIKEGHINIEDKEQVIKNEQKKLEKLVERASTVLWQFTSGVQRTHSFYEDRGLYEAFNLFNLDLVEEGEMLVLDTDGYHRTIYINSNHLDYIYIPKHKFNRGYLESLESSIDC